MPGHWLYGNTRIVALWGTSKTIVMLWVGKSQLSEANICTWIIWRERRLITLLHTYTFDTMKHLYIMSTTLCWFLCRVYIKLFLKKIQCIMLVLQEILNSEFTIQENLGFFLVQYTVNFYIFHIQKKKAGRHTSRNSNPLLAYLLLCIKTWSNNFRVLETTVQRKRRNYQGECFYTCWLFSAHSHIKSRGGAISKSELERAV